MKKTLKIRGQQNRKKMPKIIAIAIFFLVIAAVIFCIEKFNLFGIHDVKQQNIRNKELGISEEKVSDEDKQKYKVSNDLPRFLTIERIGVENARMMSVGVMSPDENGGQQMEAVSGVHDVGWYDCRDNPVADRRCTDPTIPGDGDTETAAILEGHSCVGGSDCVFNRLSELKSGDKIVIETGDGKKLNYVVKKIKTVALEDVDMNEMLTPIEKGKEGVNIMTCFGAWTEKDSQGVATMNQRVMVFAARE